MPDQNPPIHLQDLPLHKLELLRYAMRHVVVEASGRLLYANEYVEQLSAGGFLALSDSKLTFTDRPAQIAYEQALGSWRSRIPQHDTLEFLMHGRLEGCFGVRLHRHLTAQAASSTATETFLVTIQPLDGQLTLSADDVRRFGMLFGLTNGEQRVTLAVAHDISLADHAQSAGLALDTIRKYLKSALFKTGARSQKALIRKLERFCFLASH